MNCSNCGHENILGSNFCNKCGSPLEANKVSLGRYFDTDQGNSPFKKKNREEKIEFQEEMKDSIQYAAGGEKYASGDIYDRDAKSRNMRRGLPLKLTLVAILAIFIMVGVYGVKFAVNTQDKRITQAELLKEQAAEAEELKKLENYREKFSSVIASYEEQGALIEENINGLTTLKINRFAQGLGLGDGFNTIVNKLFDVSNLNELKDQNSTLDVLVGELIAPPNTFVDKYETLLILQETSHEIIDTFSDKITSEAEKNLVSLNETYSKLLTDLKR
ncbi:MAG: zinc ribbon domain-containing protein [Clostridiaceae bacterium]